VPNHPSWAEWTRTWLRANAERILRDVTEERLFLDQYARDALAMLQRRERIPEFLRRLNSNATRFTLAMNDPWTLDRVREDWTQDLVDAAVLEARAQQIKLKPGRARRVVSGWMARDPAAIQSVRRMPRQRSIPRDACTRRFMELLVDRIRTGGELLMSLAGDVAVGAQLPEKARNCQLHLLRFLRAHAVLANRDADGPWREAALLDTWTGHGFMVDGIPDLPEAMPVASAEPRKFELSTHFRRQSRIRRCPSPRF